MCRIYGYCAQRPISKRILEKVSTKQLSGGPDEQRFIQKENWGLGNNRLAIQGIHGGQQPFHLNGIYCVFNGEIYNHNKLRRHLIEKGYVFTDTCDGSILPALYQEYGVNFVKKLDGMFAIALVDTINFSKNRFFIFSDPIGIKSVYYAFDKNHKIFSFASEIPALLEFNTSSKAIRLEALNEYLSGRAIWGSKTIFQDIKQLEPSSILTFSLERGISIERYESHVNAEIISSDIISAGIELNTLLEEEVKQMLCADVPACVVTSGGLDSSYITAIAAKFSPNLHSFNIAYSGKWPFDEKEYAKKIARQYKTRYHQIEIHEHEFITLLEKMLTHIGQPNTAPHCISTYALFSAIRENGFKVALTGEGADEMFGGYKRFATATYSPSANWQDDYLDKLSAVKKSLRWNLYSDSYKKWMNNQDDHEAYCRNMINELSKEHSKLDSLLHFDQDYRFPYYILRRVDHLSMANSVEVRVPFCQQRIRSVARKLPAHLKLDKTNVKKILYSAAKDKLDKDILTRPKQPFTLPITAMLHNGHPLMSIAKETLLSATFMKRDFFNSDAIRQLIDSQTAQPNDDSAEAIWSLMTVELWAQINDIDYYLE